MKATPHTQLEHITREQIDGLFICDPKSGWVRWRNPKRGMQSRHEYAGSVTPGGYLKVFAFGHPIFIHRLLWRYVYGVWPTEIDHIDGDRSNNSIGNLREVTRHEQMGNLGLACNNRSGFRGVIWNRWRLRWEARIKHGKTTRFLGAAPTAEAAAKLYAAAAEHYWGHFFAKERAAPS